MKMNELRNIAKLRGIETGSLLKAGLITAILNDEDSLDDYANDHECDQVDCPWRRDCVDDAL